jgi:hypothetical protein
MEDYPRWPLWLAVAVMTALIVFLYSVPSGNGFNRLKCRIIPPFHAVARLMDIGVIV